MKGWRGVVNIYSEKWTMTSAEDYGWKVDRDFKENNEDGEEEDDWDGLRRWQRHPVSPPLRKAGGRTNNPTSSTLLMDTGGRKVGIWCPLKFESRVTSTQPLCRLTARWPAPAR